MVADAGRPWCGINELYHYSTKLHRQLSFTQVINNTILTIAANNYDIQERNHVIMEKNETILHWIDSSASAISPDSYSSCRLPSHTLHNHTVTKCAVQRWEKAQNVLKFNIKQPQGWVKKLRSLLYSLDRKVDIGAIRLWFTFHLNTYINFTQWIDSLPVPWFAWTSERKKITRPWVSFKLLAILGNKHN